MNQAPRKAYIPTYKMQHMALTGTTLIPTAFSTEYTRIALCRSSEGSVLKIINLDQQASVNHVRGRLSLGNLLASRVSALPLESGSVSALLPEHVSPSEASSVRILRDGGVVHPGEGQEIERAVAELVSAYLSRGDRQCAIFEHSLARASDPWVSNCEVPLFIQDSKIFLYLTALAAQPDRVLRTMRTARTSLAMIAILTHFDTPDEISDRQSAPAGLLDRLAANTQHVIVDAYDGEGFLVWNKYAAGATD